MTFLSFTSYGQGEKSFVVLMDDKVIYETTDSLDMASNINETLASVRKDGYITSRLDTVIIALNTTRAFIYKGDRYEFGIIDILEHDRVVLEDAGLHTYRWAGKQLSPSTLSSFSNILIGHLENSGFPFAACYLDDVDIRDGRLGATLVVDKGTYVPFDSLKVGGPLRLSKNYLHRYLDIKQEAPYSRKKVARIAKRIQDLPFIEMDSTPIVTFVNGHAQVRLDVKPKKASRFDFLIGVLPNNVNGQRKFTITGNFTAEMYNKLGYGEYIFAHIQRLSADAEDLQLRFSYPYIFNLPIEVSLKGSIYRNGNDFRETTGEAGLGYHLDGGNTFKLLWSSKASRLLEINEASILNSKQLPGNLDVVFTGGSLDYRYQSLDYRFNPSQGFDIQFRVTLGVKSILRNNSILALSTEETDFGLAYDSLQLSSFQTESLLNLAYYKPMFGVGSVKLGLRGGFQYNEARIYDNERFRIGGNAILRGFDEQSILADIYGIATLEYRIFLDRNSYLSLPFVDYGITRTVVNGANQWDTAFGLGLGINFATPAGIFNVSFAAGKRLDNPLDFGNTKIHFGYVSLF